MKDLLNNKRDFIERIFMLICVFIWNQSVYYGARMLTGSWKHYDMTLKIDELTPFIPWTVSIYFACYLFWCINYYICSKKPRPERDRFFCADFMAKTICLICFLIVPTTNVRPELTGDQGIWNFLMEFLYGVDAADNLFPSIHCLVSWFCWIGVRKRKDVHVVYRWFSLAFALAVCVSTLTTKQHVIVDVIGGVLLAELCYALAALPKVCGIYSSFYSRVLKILKI